MKAKIEKRDVVVVIEMTEEEALWLKGLVQTPFDLIEPDFHGKACTALWHALNEAGIKL